MNRQPNGDAKRVSFDAFVDELAGLINALDDRSQARLFWLYGCGLATRLSAPPEWAAWIADARERGRRIGSTGREGAGDREAWAVMDRLTQTTEISQHLLSTVVCLSAPLQIVIAEGPRSRGAWAEEALFPVLHAESQRLFGDISFPGDDDDLDRALEQPRAQRAANYCRDVAASVDGASEAEIADLLEKSGVLSPGPDPTVSRGDVSAFAAAAPTDLVRASGIEMSGAEDGRSW